MFDPMQMVPSKCFLTRGVGRHSEKLTSFEMALRDARIEKYNLVRVSSIVPPGCAVVPRNEGLNHLRPGQVVFTVLAEMATNEPSRMVAASIGMAIPADPARHGYVSEHHSFGQNEQTAGDYAEDLAATMLATTLDVPFDAEQDWDARREAYLMSGEIVRSRSVTQSAECHADGRWTTVVAACVFVAFQ